MASSHMVVLIANWCNVSTSVLCCQIPTTFHHNFLIWLVDCICFTLYWYSDIFNLVKCLHSASSSSFCFFLAYLFHSWLPTIPGIQKEIFLSFYLSRLCLSCFESDIYTCFLLQVAASMQKDVDGHVPSYPNLPSKLICLLHNVTLHVICSYAPFYCLLPDHLC